MMDRQQQGGTVCDAIQYAYVPGTRGTVFSAVIGPGGPSFLPRTFRGDHFQFATSARICNST